MPASSLVVSVPRHARRACVVVLAVALAVGVGACGDASQSAALDTTGGGTNNASTANAGTSSTNAGTTDGGTTSGPSDDVRCVRVCQDQAACAELSTACGDAFAAAYGASCETRCNDDAEREAFLARDGIACSTLIPALIVEPGFTDDCDPSLLIDDTTPDPVDPERIEVGECAEFVACGGDPVGSWVIDQLCVEFDAVPEDNGDDPIPECEGERTIYNITSATGALDVYDDGTYRQEIVFGADLIFLVPQTCLQDTLGLSCATYETALTDATDAVWTCDDGEETCACATPIEGGEAEVTTGQWSLREDTLTMVADNSTDGPLPLEVCGEGDKLDLAVGAPGTEFYYHLDMTRRVE